MVGVYFVEMHSTTYSHNQLGTDRWSSMSLMEASAVYSPCKLAVLQACQQQSSGGLITVLDVTSDGKSFSQSLCDPLFLNWCSGPVPFGHGTYEYSSCEQLLLKQNQWQGYQVSIFIPKVRLWGDLIAQHLYPCTYLLTDA